MFDLEKIKTRVLRGESVEDAVKYLELGWRDFEDVVAAIFEAHDFSVRRNFRFKTRSRRNEAGRRYEIDVIAAKGGSIFCVDCKQWSGGRYKKSAVISAANKQKERTSEFGKFLKGNAAARETLHAGKSAAGKEWKTKPLIVTLLEEDITKVRGVFIAPLWKLNAFLLELYT
jgi:Holliday junction resolvase-like predicted endonuclease